MGKGKVVAKGKGGAKQNSTADTKSKGSSSTVAVEEGPGASSRAAKRAGKGKSGKSTSWAGYQDDLAEELHALGLRIKKITADGNCFFRALGDQLKGDEGMHSELRAQIVSYVRDHEEDFAPFVEDDESFGTYIARMKKDGIWAGNIELVAASHTLNVNITIYQAGQPRWAIKHFDEGAVPMLHLSYHDGQHYNSVRMLSDPCTGPPVPIVLGGDGIIKRTPAPEGGAGWGEKEVLRVSSSTACHDLALVRWALEQARGDPDVAIEKVIERLASLPEEDIAEDDMQSPAAQAVLLEASSSMQSAQTQQVTPAEINSTAHTDAQPVEQVDTAVSSQEHSQGDEQQVGQVDGNSAVQSAASSGGDHGSEMHSAAQVHFPDRLVSDDTPSSADDASTAAPTAATDAVGVGLVAGESNSATATTAPASVTAAAAAAKPKKKVKTSVKLTGASTKAPARNKDCPCGSKRKYKNCCGPAAAAAARRLAAGGTADASANSQSLQVAEGVAVGKAAQIHAITI